jgi:Adenosine deaminase
MAAAPAPKIELHVHLEGAVRPRALLEIAARNGVSLPAASEAELAKLYQFRDFAHFLELWLMTTCALQKEQDFRQVVVEYATEAASHGAVAGCLPGQRKRRQQAEPGQRDGDEPQRRQYEPQAHGDPGQSPRPAPAQGGRCAGPTVADRASPA